MRYLHGFITRHRADMAAAGRVLLIAGILVLLRTAAAHAGNDPTFQDLTDLMENWTKGTLGKSLALIALILGIGVAAARQSFGALFGGVGVAAAATIGPGVIDSVMTSTF